ncbi:hypothetical protein CPB84DRAFT_1764622 [Gymnopilus junonius]|uniref:Ketoreductase (KR) domain-containing protein n=1 Tax=Gymnopilus junonius TaxID=109634 RepID=A0A9P5NXG7_GYMJU|nr:hypothetical protein CPB84DRAFT_1764622 [Gymnopilus junonius]
MVLRIAEAFASAYFPTKYLFHIAAGIITVLVLRAFSQGRTTNRERDLHARTILLTGGFTPLGLTLLQSLAQRGAHNVSIIIDLIRNDTSNEQVYAEECDLTSPSSIRAFCTKFLTGKEQRLDAIIFAHEHKHIGSPKLFSRASKDQDQKERDALSLATFLITTLLLPALLVAPAERDIRIINVVNPFYAAAAGLPFSPSFDAPESTSKSKSIFLSEGRRSLRSIVFTRHLQRVLDALPTTAPIPETEEGSKAIPIVSSKLQKSNIVAVSASPGIGRVDTASSLLNADFMSPTGSYLGLLCYVGFQPLLRILTKTPAAAMQTILHVLFLPTPFKLLAATKAAKDKTPKDALDASSFDMLEEVLLPGALYADCSAVKLTEKDRQMQAEAAKAKAKGKKEDQGSLEEEVLDIVDDGEYGGELAGRLIWEEYEVALKVWEKENPGKVQEEKTGSGKTGKEAQEKPSARKSPSEKQGLTPN